MTAFVQGDFVYLNHEQPETLLSPVKLLETDFSQCISPFTFDSDYSNTMLNPNYLTQKSRPDKDILLFYIRKTLIVGQFFSF